MSTNKVTGIESTLEIVESDAKRLQERLINGTLHLSNDRFEQLVAKAYRRYINKTHPGTSEHDIVGYAQNYFTIYINETTEWNGTDTYNQFQENKHDPRKRALLEENGWIKSDGSPVPIKYKYNKLGFRDEHDDYDDSEPSILCIGLSDVTGLGMFLEDTWPKLLGKELGIRSYSMGVNLGSLDANIRLYDYWKDIIKPTYTFMSYSSTTKRFEVDLKPVGPWHSKEAMEKMGVYEYYLDEEWRKLKIEENFKYLRSEGVFLYTNEVAYDAYDDYDFLADWYSNEDYAVTDPNVRNKPSFARDLIHAGKTWHEYICNSFKEII